MISYQDFIPQAVESFRQESPENAAFLETRPTIQSLSEALSEAFPDINLNLFGDIGNALKWAAIGIGALVGVYLIAKILGGKR